MTKAQLLVGSLSNDLFRVANLTHRGSTRGAIRFLNEAQRWSRSLENENVDGYIKEIARNISSQTKAKVTLKNAENYLMYAVLLHNYLLHRLKRKSS